MKVSKLMPKEEIVHLVKSLGVVKAEWQLPHRRTGFTFAGALDTIVTVMCKPEEPVFLGIQGNSTKRSDVEAVIAKLNLRHFVTYREGNAYFLKYDIYEEVNIEELMKDDRAQETKA